MVFDFVGVNWVAVIVAAVAGVIVGFVWYLPQVFGRRWAAAAGRELPAAGEVSPMIYVLSIVVALVTAYVLTLFAAGLGITGPVDGLVLAFVAWLGFVATATLNSVIFEGKSTEYWLINAGYLLVSLLVMGAIIGVLGA